MRRHSEDLRLRIVALRRSGKSIPEIVAETGVAKTTVQRYVLGIVVPPEYRKILREKQGGSKERAAGLRANILETSSRQLGDITDRDLLLLLVGLYWGEGTKRDFSVINSDPQLIQTFLYCLYSRGIKKDRISLSLRVHDDISINAAKKFWSATTGLALTSIGRVEVIAGKKKGKLPYGMCRVRVRSGIRDRLMLQTAISLIGKDCAKK